MNEIFKELTAHYKIVLTWVLRRRRIRKFLFSLPAMTEIYFPIRGVKYTISKSWYLSVGNVTSRDPSTWLGKTSNYCLIDLEHAIKHNTVRCQRLDD